MGRSSMNMSAMCGISSLSMNAIHAWNSAGELVNPIGNDVRRRRPSGDIKAVRSRLVGCIFLASNPQCRSNAE